MAGNIETAKKRGRPRKETIGDKIKRYRIEKKMSVVELAKKSGIHENTIYAAENKGVIPRLPTLMKICEALDIPLEMILK